MLDGDTTLAEMVAIRKVLHKSNQHLFLCMTVDALIRKPTLATVLMKLEKEGRLRVMHVDEAHLLANDGPTYRPIIMQLPYVLGLLKKIRVCFFSATSTKMTVEWLKKHVISSQSMTVYRFTPDIPSIFLQWLPTPSSGNFAAGTIEQIIRTCTDFFPHMSGGSDIVIKSSGLILLDTTARVDKCYDIFKAIYPTANVYKFHKNRGDMYVY
jgi:superfamily II DNA helicase RecQ